MIHPLLIFLSCAAQPYQHFFLDVSMFLLVQREWLGIAQESRTTQASPRVDVDEAPYAPGNDLLYVTELEDAHDLIKLRKTDDILELFFPETLPMLDSIGTSGQCNKTCLDDTYSAQPIAGIIKSQFENEIPSVRKSSSRTQQCSTSVWS